MLKETILFGTCCTHSRYNNFYITTKNNFFLHCYSQYLMTKSDQNAQFWMTVLKFIPGQKTERGVDLRIGTDCLFQKRTPILYSGDRLGCVLCVLDCKSDLIYDFYLYQCLTTWIFFTVVFPPLILLQGIDIINILHCYSPWQAIKR